MFFKKKNQTSDDFSLEYEYNANDNIGFDSLDDESKRDLEKVSDEDYRKITSRIVEISSEQLNTQNESKKSLKDTLMKFFRILLYVQMGVLFLLIILNGACGKFNLSDSVLITLITSMFVETLGGVIVMVKYAFNSNQEVEILKILNSVVQNYQKYHQRKNDEQQY